MAALQPTVGGLPTLQPPAAPRTFAQVLSRAADPAPSSLDPSVTHDDSTTGTHKGSPAIFFTPTHLHSISKPFAWTLVGKFSHGYNKINPKLGRPSMADLHQYFVALDLKGEFSIGLLDNRHVLIQIQSEEDYLRIYSRMVWYIGAITMRIFRWSPFFRVDKETSVVPVWITFPRLPVMFFEQQSLFAIGRLIGHPLRRDSATIALKRPSVARLQVELDLMKPRPDKIWIGMGDSDGYWQKVEYEHVPEYCQHCWHVGHAASQCHVQYPGLKDTATVPKSSLAEPSRRPVQKYVPVRNLQPPMHSDQGHAPVSDPMQTAHALGKTPVVVESPQHLPATSPAVSSALAVGVVAVGTSFPAALEHSVSAIYSTVVTPVVGVDPPPEMPTVPVNTSFLKESAAPLLVHEVGFHPQPLGEVFDHASSVDEEIEILDEDPPFSLLSTAPNYQFNGVDDLFLLRKRDKEEPYPFHSASRLSQGSVIPISKEAEFSALRAFKERLQSWLPDAAPQCSQPVPKRRGRPRKTALENLTQIAVPTHPMVTRSITHSTSLVFDE